MSKFAVLIYIKNTCLVNKLVDFKSKITAPFTFIGAVKDICISEVLGEGLSNSYNAIYLKKIKVLWSIVFEIRYVILCGMKHIHHLNFY